MNEHNLVLTKTDRAILESYKSMMDGLSVYLGKSYELVLHSLESYEHSVIKIINGFHTGRTVGAPITDLALSMLEVIRTRGDNNGYISYFTRNKNGEPLKSATITIVGENKRIIGLLCINMYLNTPFNEVISEFVNLESLEETKKNSGPIENFVENINDLIGNSVTQVRQRVFNDDSVPSNCKNKEIIHQLNEMGIFKIKDAVNKVADALNISKNTVYMHIRNQNTD
ncbi:MAG: hypothetical protein GX922_06740 [Firmicutes bacterium]|jgi:predicted transcriptional regulator YheO|nr:hypothetical protein [Bacillota bacterium]